MCFLNVNPSSIYRVRKALVGSLSEFQTLQDLKFGNYLSEIHQIRVEIIKIYNKKK